LNRHSEYTVESINPHISRVQVWFENNWLVFVSKLAEITDFCKITSTSSCLVYWREKYYLCWSPRSVWITEGPADIWIQWCRHEVSIYPSVVPLNWYQYFYYADDMLRLWISVLKWNNTVVIWSSLLQETFLRSYIFPRIHIQGKESSSPDLQSMCRS